MKKLPYAPKALGASLFNFERTSFVIYWEWGQRDLNSALASKSSTEKNQEKNAPGLNPFSKLLPISFKFLP